MKNQRVIVTIQLVVETKENCNLQVEACAALEQLFATDTIPNAIYDVAAVTMRTTSVRLHGCEVLP